MLDNDDGRIHFGLHRTSLPFLIRSRKHQVAFQVFPAVAASSGGFAFRPLPERDYELLDDLQKKRYLVLPGTPSEQQTNGQRFGAHGLRV